MGEAINKNLLTIPYFIFVENVFSIINFWNSSYLVVDFFLLYVSFQILAMCDSILRKVIMAQRE